MKTYKAAIIGCGRIGVTMEADPKRIKPATHAGAFSLDPLTQLSALVDPDASALQKGQALFPGVAGFSDAQQMLEKIQPEIVSICVPPAQHRSLVELCARFAVPAIVCEKPIAETMGDGEAMIQACRRSGSLLFVNHNRRFDSLLNRARKDVQAGLIGEVLSGSAYYTAGLFNSGTHLVDLLRFFLGDVKECWGVPELRFSCPVGDQNINGFLFFNGGVSVSLQALDVRDYVLFEARLYGRKGMLTIGRSGFAIETEKVRESVDFAGYKELDVEGRVRTGESRSLMEGLVKNVVAALEKKASPLSRGEDGAAALEVLLQLAQSAKQGGKKIELSKSGVTA